MGIGGVGENNQELIMSDKKKDWDEIPSLDGLQMDWDYSGQDALAKRRFERLSDGDMTSIFEVKNVPVRVATSDFTADGILSDISGGGVAVVLRKELAIGQHVKVGFFLGRQKIVSQAIVKQSIQIQSGYKIGFQFDNIKEEDSRYINGLYASKALNR